MWRALLGQFHGLERPLAELSQEALMQARTPVLLFSSPASIAACVLMSSLHKEVLRCFADSPLCTPAGQGSVGRKCEM